MENVNEFLKVLSGDKSVKVAVDIPAVTIAFLSLGLLGAITISLLIYGAIFNNR